MTEESSSPPAPSPREHREESIKEVFESIIIAFVFAFVFRAFVVEAFVIPTGSMAPTLLGEHMVIQCDQCGYRFTVGVGQADRMRGYVSGEESAVCPMCQYPNDIAAGTRVRWGDRILVLKYLYAFREPRRWDVVVFKAPHQPRTNYIKRLIGKPNEKLAIFDGNVYLRPLSPDRGEPTGPWRIARKSDRPAVQRAVWQPVYSSQYIPLDRGEPALSRREVSWDSPWEAVRGRWRIDHRRSYTHPTSGPGRIAFRFPRRPAWAVGSDQPRWLGLYPYNQLGPSALEPVEDVRIAATVQPREAGLHVALSTTARLKGDTPRRLTARLGPDGWLTLEAAGPAGRTRELARRRVDPPRAGHNTPIELWYVDQEASVWIDGERMLGVEFDLPMSRLLKRPPPPARPRIRLDVAGAPVTLHRVEVDRDLYYSSIKNGAQTLRGGLWRLGNKTAGHVVTLGPKEYFCLGDNSPVSADSRYWLKVQPWVTRRLFAGRFRPGIVPEELLMGRAFFVYLPAPLSWNPEAPPVTFNFGDMRFIK